MATPTQEAILRLIHDLSHRALVAKDPEAIKEWEDIKAGPPMDMLMEIHGTGIEMRVFVGVWNRKN